MSDGCLICGSEKHALARACQRCKKILDRIETRRAADGTARRISKDARVRALQRSWRDGAFHCFYTDIQLVTDPQRWRDHRDHRYLTFEHQTPGEEESVVVACALVNRMKTDLSDRDFRAFVTELAKTFTGGTFDERIFPERKQPLPGG